MVHYGGSFASNLGKALQCADVKNEAKIKSAWPELMTEYADMARHYAEAIPE